MKRLCRFSIAAVVLALVASGAEAKHIYRAPELDSSAYWDTHEIGVVEITSVKTSGELDPDVGIKTLSVFTAGPWPKMERLPGRIFYATSGIPPDLSVGERLILCLPHTPPQGEPDLAMVFAIDKDGKPVQTSSDPTMADAYFDPPPATFTLRGCEMIGRIRNLPDALDRLSEALSLDEPLALGYAINGVVEAKKPADAAMVAAQLDKIRRGEDQSVEVRVRASRALNKVEGRTAATSDHWKWVLQTAERSAGPDVAGVERLMEEVLTDEPHRAEVVDFLVRMVRDAKMRQPVRLVAIDTMIRSSVLFKGIGSGDPLSDRMLETMVGAMKDKDPAVRTRAGTQIVNAMWAMSIRSPGRLLPEMALTCLETVSAPIKAAAAAEKDPEAKKAFESLVARLDSIEGGIVGPIRKAAVDADAVVIAAVSHMDEASDDGGYTFMLEVKETLRGQAAGPIVKARVDLFTGIKAGLKEKGVFIFFLAGKQADTVLLVLTPTEGTLKLVRESLPLPRPAPGGAAPK